MQSADDKTLMLRFQSEGDPSAFEELFRRNKDLLLRFLRRLAGDEAIAEDISQQVWMRVIEVAEAGRYQAHAGASFSTFLLAMARNRYIDQEHRSHEARYTQPVEHATLDAMGDDASLPPELLVDDEQMRSLLDQALRTLPLEQREVLALWMQGVELVEVAGVTGVPWATLVSRKKYALRKVKLFLERAGVRRSADVIA
jgi:RNA polymerase sigma-70 factor, ECF subfamily